MNTENKQNSEELKSENYQEYHENNDIIMMIKRQTTYDIDTIKRKLKEHNKDPEKVIREYHGLSAEKIDTFQGSNNQKIFKSIREFF